jgi:heat shock protein HslJ
MRHLAHQLRVDRRGLLRAGYFILLTMMAAQASAHDLAGSEWRPTRIGSISLTVGTPLFVQFKAEEKLFIFSGCNYLAGTYRIAPPEIILSAESAPSSPCPGAYVHLEFALLVALRAARRFERHRATLSLFNSDGDSAAEFAQSDWD